MRPHCSVLPCLLCTCLLTLCHQMEALQQQWDHTSEAMEALQQEDKRCKKHINRLQQQAEVGGSSACSLALSVSTAPAAPQLPVTSGQGLGELPAKHCLLTLLLMVLCRLCHAVHGDRICSVPARHHLARQRRCSSCRKPCKECQHNSSSYRCSMRSWAAARAAHTRNCRRWCSSYSSSMCVALAKL